MKRNFIRNIIGLATILLIGLIVTQVTWVKKAYEIEQKQFGYDVTQTLLTSLDDLQKSIGDSSLILNPVVQEKPNFFVVKLPFSSDHFLIQAHVERAFQTAVIKDKYILNIYDCFSDSVVFCKNYCHDSNRAKGKIPPLNWNREQGHYFSIYFPDRSINLFSQMEFWIYSSIIIIVIIAFFGFIISQLLKQRRINDMKTDFINNMTHEFKTPLSTIAISVDALMKPTILEKPDRLKRYTGIIQSENQRLQQQVERILQAATIEKEKVNLKKIPVNVHEVLEELITIFGVNIESKQGEITASLLAKNSQILGDTEHLKNIFSNLIDNAIKYSPDKLAISITTKNIGNSIEIAIQDSGLGISKEHQSQVFEKFYRVPTGNIHDVKGFGIGLNYVNLLVLKHDGSIKLKSQIGVGSTFIISFKTI
jgi:two-component system phosphate regulon sensor histidine kinase PhoR